MKTYQLEEKLFHLNSTLFKSSATVFALLFIVEYFIPGFVSSWFNLLYLLIIALISGILHVLNELHD